MTQAYSNYNVMGKVDCMRSRDVTQSRFLVIFFDKFKIKMLKKGDWKTPFFWLAHNRTEKRV